VHAKYCEIKNNALTGKIQNLIGWFMVFSATFKNISVIVAVSFIGRGNWNTRRKPPTCRKHSFIEFRPLPGRRSH